MNVKLFESEYICRPSSFNQIESAEFATSKNIEKHINTMLENKNTIEIVASMNILTENCDFNTTGLMMNCLVPSYMKDRRASLTLPWPLIIGQSKLPGAGLGVWTNYDLPMGLLFGPYEGKVQTEVPKSAYVWMIATADCNYYVDANDPSSSNWLRYVNCGRNKYENNLTAIQYNQKIYYKINQPILRGSELMVWYGDYYGSKLGLNRNSMLWHNNVQESSFSCVTCFKTFDKEQELFHHFKECFVTSASSSKCELPACAKELDSQNCSFTLPKVEIKVGNTNYDCKIINKDPEVSMSFPSSEFRKNSKNMISKSEVIKKTGQRLKKNDYQPNKVHGNPPSVNQISGKLFKFTCVKCNMQYRHCGNLKRHQAKCGTMVNSYSRKQTTKPYSILMDLKVPGLLSERKTKCKKMIFNYDNKRSCIVTKKSPSCPFMIVSSSSNVISFKCDNCSNTYNNVLNLLQHDIEHSKTSPLQCGTCGWRFSKFLNLKCHMQLNHPEISKKELNENYRRSSVNLRKCLKNEYLDTKGIRSMIDCNQCQLQFSEYSNWVQMCILHMNKKHFQMKELQEDIEWCTVTHIENVTGNGSAGLKLNCPICYEKFNNQLEVERHKYSHISSKMKKCKLCHVWIGSSVHLKEHLEYHKLVFDRHILFSIFGFSSEVNNKLPETVIARLQWLLYKTDGIPIKEIFSPVLNSKNSQNIEDSAAESASSLNTSEPCPRSLDSDDLVFKMLEVWQPHTYLSSKFTNDASEMCISEIPFVNENNFSRELLTSLKKSSINKYIQPESYNEILHQKSNAVSDCISMPDKHTNILLHDINESTLCRSTELPKIHCFAEINPNNIATLVDDEKTALSNWSENFIYVDNISLCHNSDKIIAIKCSEATNAFNTSSTDTDKEKSTSSYNGLTEHLKCINTSTYVKMQNTLVVKLDEIKETGDERNITNISLNDCDSFYNHLSDSQNFDIISEIVLNVDRKSGLHILCDQADRVKSETIIEWDAKSEINIGFNSYLVNDMERENVDSPEVISEDVIPSLGMPENTELGLERFDLEGDLKNSTTDSQGLNSAEVDSLCLKNSCFTDLRCKENFNDLITHFSKHIKEEDFGNKDNTITIFSSNVQDSFLKDNFDKSSLICSPVSSNCHSVDHISRDFMNEDTSNVDFYNKEDYGLSSHTTDPFLNSEVKPLCMAENYLMESSDIDNSNSHHGTSPKHNVFNPLETIDNDVNPNDIVDNKLITARENFIRGHVSFGHSMLQNSSNFLSHSCKVCGKNFQNLLSLKEHKMAHIITYRFCCKHCKKQFRDHNTYLFHLTTHLTFFNCECGSKLIANSSLFLHHDH